MLGLKMDLYQPKYANMPVTYNVTACPPGSALLEGKYGVGTVFSGFNVMGQQQSNSITECSFTSGGTGLVVCTHTTTTARGATGEILVTHTTTALPNGDCEFTLAMDGPNINRAWTAAQLSNMKAFIEANVAAICADAPPAGRAVVVAAVVVAVAAPAAPAAAAGPPSAFCSGCGKANESGGAFCTGCGAATGPPPTAGAGAAPAAGVVVATAAKTGFVEVPQIANAQRAGKLMLAVAACPAANNARRRNGRQ